MPVGLARRRPSKSRRGAALCGKYADARSGDRSNQAAAAAASSLGPPSLRLPVVTSGRDLLPGHDGG